jgi:hypothetical protein
MVGVSVHEGGRDGQALVDQGKKSVALLLPVVLALGRAVRAQVDSLQVVVSNANCFGNVANPPAIGAFGWDPQHDRIYVAGATGQYQQIRVIDNLSTTPVATTLMYATPWTVYTKAGDPNNGGGGPFPGSFLLNPQPLVVSSGAGTVELPAYSSAWIVDGASVVTTDGGSLAHPDWTQKIYRYNLQLDTNGDASDEFTPVMTLAQLQAAGSFTTNLTTITRQHAWSGNGKLIYFIDSTPSAGGVYVTPAVGGTTYKILGAGITANTEPAVSSSGGVDTIYFRGGGTNVGGIDKITYDAEANTGSASVRAVALSASAINSFLELSSGSISIAAMTADAVGNIYFNSASSIRGGIYRWDTQGRLSKVVSSRERLAALGTLTGPQTVNTSRMQPRITQFAGPTGTFNVSQILYCENPVSQSKSLIAGAFAFLPGDFNRDNTVDHQDTELFKSALTTKGVAASDANLKFDLNGNDEVSWKDVKILQQFYAFPDGDANIDRTVDINDLWAVASHWSRSGQTWITGDFTGEGVVNAKDLGILAQHWQQSSAPLSFDQALQAVGLARMVPEPADIAVACLGLVGAMVRRRRR